MIEYSNGSHADFQPSGGNLHFGVVPLEAIATASGHAQSNVGSAAYTINLPTVATPVFSPGAGSYNSSQSVSISDATGGAKP